MKKLLVFVFLVLSACQTVPLEPIETKSATSPGQSKPHVAEVILDHKYFVISYNPQFEIANAVTYRLTREHLMSKVTGRSNHFHADPQLLNTQIPSADQKSYKHSGYQRGHLAPSADFEWDKVANEESFVMSNMTPQKPGLNMFAWRYLETRVRKWACTEGSLEIVVGPVLTDISEKLPSGVAVPKRFFKVVLDETPPRKALGFIYNQEDRKDVYKERVMSVAEVEKVTGQKFFPELSADEREKVEAASDLSQWKEEKCW